MQGTLKSNLNNSAYLELERLIPPDHILRKIDKVVDFSFVNSETESCYCPNNGRPSIPPELYFRMELIGYFFNIRSARKLVEDVRYNISYRWFCKLTINDNVPNHASLSRIKNRYSCEIFEKFFHSILYQCGIAGLLDSNSVMTDSILIQANASLDSMQPREGSYEKIKSPTPGVAPPPKREISNITHQSISDPDATLAFKAGTTRSLKYKAHTCIDSKSRVISAIKITTGAVHDSQPYLELIKHLTTDLELNINETIADRAYGVGHIIFTLREQGIETFIPLFSGRSGASRHTVTDGFYYDKEKNVYVCPANFELTPGKIYKDYFAYHSSAKNCRNCHIRQNCKAPEKKSSYIRVITRHQHFDLFQSIQQEMETRSFKKKLSERLWKIEGVMNELKNYHGLTKARFRGLQNMQIQAYMAAIAVNIKRLIFIYIFLRLCRYSDQKISAFTTGRVVF